MQRGKIKSVVFEQGNLIEDDPIGRSSRRKGTKVFLSLMILFLNIINIEQNMFLKCSNIMFI